MAQREAQKVQLLRRGGEQEIALVLAAVEGAVEFRSRLALHALDVVTRRHAVRAQIARDLQQVAELDRLVAAHAGDRGRAHEIGVGEILNHGVAEVALVIQNVMREADGLGHTARIIDVLARAARLGRLHRRAVIVELQRHADDFVPLPGQQGGADGTVHPAAHRDHDTGIRLGFRKSERVGRSIGNGIGHDGPHIGAPARRVELRAHPSRCDNPQQNQTATGTIHRNPHRH